MEWKFWRKRTDVGMSFPVVLMVAVQRGRKEEGIRKEEGRGGRGGRRKEERGKRKKEGGRA
jgi:hypothetical protein